MPGQRYAAKSMSAGKPDFLKMNFYSDGPDDEFGIEGLWVSLHGTRYKLENIPFFIKEFALGDLVSGHIIDGKLTVGQLIGESGNSTIQIVFFNPEIIKRTRSYLQTVGCSSELSHLPNLIAVNIPSEVECHEVVKPYLDAGKHADDWDYQEACLAHLQKSGTLIA